MAHPTTREITSLPFSQSPGAEVWQGPSLCSLAGAALLSEFRPDTKVPLSPALPAALVTTLPSYSLGSSSTAKRRSGGPGPGPSLWPPQPAHLSTHCQVWAQCDPPLPSLCQPAFLLTAQNPTSDPEDISKERWPLPSDSPHLQYPVRDEFFPGLLVLWPRRALSPGLKLAPPEKLLPSLQTVKPRLWPSRDACLTPVHREPQDP